VTTYASINGTYRIDEITFPTPITEWEDQELAQGLNGIPINASYRIHRWNFDELDGEIANALYDKYQEQQSGNAQLSELETDPYDASLANEEYGTETFSDFVIISPGVRRRDMPNYSNITVIFEIFANG
jgi:hypothetical protein